MWRDSKPGTWACQRKIKIFSSCSSHKLSCSISSPQAWLTGCSGIIQKKHHLAKYQNLQTTLLCSVPYRFVSACDIKLIKRTSISQKLMCVCKQRVSLGSLTYLWHIVISKSLIRCYWMRFFLKHSLPLYCHYSYFSQTFTDVNVTNEGNESLCNKYTFLNTQSQPDVRPKDMNILSSFTHPHVFPNLSSVEHKRRYFEKCC